MDPNVMMNRLVRLAKLDTSVFEEVRDDPRELVPALIVAGVSILLMAFGTALWYTINFDGIDNGDVWVRAFILGGLFTAGLYAAWIVVTYVVLSQFFKAQADMQSLFRTMGYAGVAFVIPVIMFIPLIWPVVVLLPLVLLIILSIYATQCVTDAEPGQVIMANLAGFTVFALVAGALAVIGDGQDLPMAIGPFAVAGVADTFMEITKAFSSF